MQADSPNVLPGNNVTKSMAICTSLKEKSEGNRNVSVVPHYVWTIYCTLYLYSFFYM